MRHVGLLMVLVAACGGSDGGSDDVEFVPIVSSTLVGRLHGTEFAIDAGIQFDTEAGVPVLVFGNGNITCESFTGDQSPKGTYAYVVPGPLGTMLAVQTYTDVNVNIETNDRTFEVVGSGGGTLTVTALSEATVAGSIDFSYEVDGSELGAIAGDFEVTRCP